MTAIGPKECPNADDVGAALHLLVQALDRVGAVQLGAMLAREGHAGQHVVFAPRHWARTMYGWLPRGKRLVMFDNWSGAAMYSASDLR